MSGCLGMESEAWEPPESSLNRLSWVINEAVAGEVSGILLNLDLLTVDYLSKISVPAMRKTGGGTDPRSAGRDGDRAARSRAGDGGGSSGRQARDAHADYAAPAAGTKCCSTSILSVNKVLVNSSASSGRRYCCRWQAEAGRCSVPHLAAPPEYSNVSRRPLFVQQ